MIQPTAQLIAAPQEAIGVKARHIPNEDSADFEFNDANLFSPDRFPGYDRIDTGSRAVYGGEIFSTGNLFGDVDLFLGQSYSLTQPNHFQKNQGLNKRASDYVGRVQASPYDWLTINYRFRLDQKTWKQKVTELGGTVGPAIARVTAMYVFVASEAGTPDNKDFQQISLNLSSQFAKHWTLVANIIKNLRKKEDGGGVFEKGIGLIYKDDCFGLGVTVKHLGYRDRDVRPETVVLGTIYLKNIGEFPWSFRPEGLFGRKARKEEAP